MGLMSGISRNEQGEIIGYFVHAGDDELRELTVKDRALWPNLAALADGENCVAARKEHSVLGSLDQLIDGWCERRDLSPLSLVLPSYLRGPGGHMAWAELLKALRTVADGFDLPEDEVVVIQRLIGETERIIST
jgi:hypothetical protein